MWRTTLDSATRLLRFNLAEIGDSIHISILNNRFVASIIAVAAICFFAFYKIDGRPAGLVLWTLFGITNQLLAGLTLLVVTLYLHQRRRNPWFTGLPAAFMLISTFVALFLKLNGFIQSRQYLLLVVGALLLMTGIGIVFEGFRVLLRPQFHDDDSVA